MSDWRLSFFRGEASLQARALGLGPARVEHAVLRLIDVAGPVELDGGIEPFANHRTALERLELTIDPDDQLLDGESARWTTRGLEITTPHVCGELALDRVGDRGLRLTPLRAWTTKRGEGGAVAMLLAWLRERLGGARIEDPVAEFAQRGLVRAGRRRTRVEGGRVGWTHESEHPVYVFDRVETPGEPLPMQSFAADYEELMALVEKGDLDGAARAARARLMEAALSDDAVPLAVDLLAERDDALDLLDELLPRVDRLTRSLALARRQPTSASWMDAVEACRKQGLESLEHSALLGLLDAGLRPEKVAEAIERLLELGRCDDGTLGRLANAAEANAHPRLAISILRRLVGRRPVVEAVSEVVRLGELHLGEGNRPRARHYFALALTVAEHAGALEGAAWIALEDQDIDYAITCLERAARHAKVIDIRRATHWRTVARLRFERADAELPAAVACLQEASLLDASGRADDLRQAALWWRKSGQLERALQCVEARLELPGEAAQWELEAAELLLELGRPGEAAGAAARALTNDELAPRIYPVLVRALRQSARDDSLPDVVRGWFNCEPDAVSDELLAVAVQGLGDRGEMAERLLANQPETNAALFRLVIEARFAQDRVDDAATLLHSALALHGDEIGIRLLQLRLGEVSDLAGERVEALANLFRLDPSDERCLAYAQAQLSVSAYTEAAELFERVDAGRLRAAAIYLDHFGDPSRCLALLGAPDRSDSEQLLLGERAAQTGDPGVVDPWSLAIFDLGLDRDEDPARVARLVASTELGNDDAERLVLALVERRSIAVEALRVLLAGVESRGLPVASARVLDALREQEPDDALDRARLDLALEANDLAVSNTLMQALYPAAAEELASGDRKRLETYLALVERAGDGVELERALGQFATLSQDADLWWRLGQHVASTGRYAESCEAFATAHGIEPESAAQTPHAWIDAARSLSEGHPLKRAVDAVASFLPMEGEQGVLVELAERLEGAEALPYWQRAHDLAPNRDYILRRLATRAVEDLGPAEAMEIVQRWLNRPGDQLPEGLAAVVRRLAERLTETGKPERGRQILGLASKRFPNELDLAGNWLAAIDEGGDDDLRASARVEAASQLDDRRADTWLREAVDIHLATDGNHQAAIELLEQLIERRPDDPEPVLQLEQLSAQAGDWQLRMKIGRRILQRELDPERQNDRLRVMADIAAQRLHDVDQALALLQEIEPRSGVEAAETTERMIQVALAGGHQDVVVDLLDQVVAEAGDDYAAVEALSRRAQARTGAGDIDGAMADLDQALGRGAEALRIAAARTELAEAAGRDELVVESLETWVDELPVGEARAAILYRLAQTLAGIDRGDEGVAPLTEALTMGTEALRLRAFEALYPLLAGQGSSPSLAELLASHAVELEDRLAAAALMAELPGGLSKALRLAEGVANAEAGQGIAGAAGWLLAALHERADEPAQAADQYALIRLRGDQGREVLRHEVASRLQAGQPANALRLIEEQDVDERDLKVETLARLGRFADAAAALENAQDSLGILRWARIVGQDLKRPEEALERLRQWVEQDPEDQGAFVLLEELATAAGDVETTAWARQSLGSLVQDNPLARSQWLHRAAQVAADAQEAVSLLKEASGLDAANQSIRQELGSALERLGQHQEAADVALELAEVADQLGTRVHHLLRAASNLRRVDSSAAGRILDRVESAVPEDARMLRMRIELAREAQSATEEVALLRRLAKITPDKSERLSALRRAAEVSGDVDLLRMVVLHDPADVDARLALAQMAERIGDLDAAVGEFHTLAEYLEGDASAAALHRAAGLLWRVRGDATAAVDLLGEALEVVDHAATFPEPFLLLSEIYESEGDTTAAAAVLTPLFDVLGDLDEEVAARVIMQAVSGGLSDIAFPHLVALEEQRPESLVLQRAVLHYLRHQRDWANLRDRLAWIGENMGDAATDLELCARAEQGMVPIHDEAVSAALERLASLGGGLSELAVAGVERIAVVDMPGEDAELVATTGGPVQVLSAPATPIDDDVMTALPADVASSAEAELEDQLPTVPAQSAREAGILPPVEGEDPPLDFDWDDADGAEARNVTQGSVDELLAQAQEAELAGRIEAALAFLEAAAAQHADDPGVQDAVASFLARHPGV